MQYWLDVLFHVILFHLESEHATVVNAERCIVRVHRDGAKLEKEPLTVAGHGIPEPCTCPSVLSFKLFFKGHVSWHWQSRQHHGR